MSYIVEQKVGDKIYVYEATSYWDKHKRQSRQKRTFLGKKDPLTGEIIKTKYSAQSVEVQSITELGPVHLVKQTMSQIGLSKCIEDVFGDQRVAIESLVSFMLIEAAPYYLQESWAKQAGQLALSSQTISDLLQGLGKDMNQQDYFFRAWNQLLGPQKVAYFDITSLSSYAKNIEFLEWGYNRDGENLEQINLGILMGETSGLPLMYRIYPGSIPDVATLEKTLQIGKAHYGLEAERLVMDRGFYSQQNLIQLNASGHAFIIPMPFSVNLARQVLSETKTQLQSPLEAFSYEGEPYFYHQTTLTLNTLELTAHLYLNENRRAKDMSTFLRRLSDLESVLAEQTFFNIQAAEEFLESHMRYSSSLFDLSYENDRVVATRRRNVLSRWMNRFGKMIILSNSKSLTKQDVLHAYRQKDCVEKYYDILKNALAQSRLRVHSQHAAEGHLFLTFLTAIVYIALSARMKKADLFKSLSIAELLAKLKTIRAVHLLDGPVVTTEISKSLRTILQKLNIPLPT